MKIFGSCNFSSGNEHPHCSDRQRGILRRLFVEVLISSCYPGFAGREGVKLDPLKKWKYFAVLLLLIKYVILKSGNLFLKTAHQNTSSTLFPKESDVCSVIELIYWFGTQWQALMIFIVVVNNIYILKIQSNNDPKKKIVVCIFFLLLFCCYLWRNNFFGECFQFAELLIEIKGSKRLGLAWLSDNSLGCSQCPHTSVFLTNTCV